MKLLLFATFVFAVYGQENFDGPEYAPVDASTIISRTDVPGFWEGREFPKEFTNPILNVRNRRIVGGVEVVPNSHPYQLALNIQLPEVTALCGGSILTVRSILTAG